MPVLSIILPIRCERSTRYLVDRLRANLAFFAAHEQVECVVVDSGSAAGYAAEIRMLCRRPRCTLVVDPAPRQPFAPGLTRNLGAAAATGGHLLFWDVDLCAGATLVERVGGWIAADPQPAEFLMIPCLYLTRAATERLRFDGRPVDLDAHVASLLAGESHLVDHLSISTSTVVVARAHYQRLGGFRPEYSGHGSEDFDLLHRLASYTPVGGRPDDYYVDHRTRFPGDYAGFRAYLARYGLRHLFDGLYTAHLWHPRPLRRRYFGQRSHNEPLLQSSMRAHDALPAQPPLPRPWATDAPVVAPLREHIAELLRAHGRDPEVDIGLFRWQPGVGPPPGATRAKLRKLLLRPRDFFADSRFPVLRRLARGYSNRSSRS
jgi:predicted glycosyltransferase involved in capsule biosynthesis